MDERGTSSIGCLLHCPYWGWSPQPLGSWVDAQPVSHTGWGQAIFFKGIPQSEAENFVKGSIKI